ncbi:hypothetical protein [Pendulispora albinea]|uniref:Uncharacterized protein n=1 Tax=Pendulispora albinea TaxID=2741071 RepID=A0ABZ2LTN6_9BACT
MVLSVAALTACSGSDDGSVNYCATTVDVNVKCDKAADCPGAGRPNTNVDCVNAACTFSCKGDTYDVNGNTSDGCEVVDPRPGYHYMDSGFNLGDDSCLDSSSREQFSGVIASDRRPHENPAVYGFDSEVGAAPDWYVIRANGGQCENDIDFQIQIRGAANPDRYLLTVVTNRDRFECRTNREGWCRVRDGSGSYSDDSLVRIRIAKIPDRDALYCAPDTAEYTVTGHL